MLPKFPNYGSFRKFAGSGFRVIIDLLQAFYLFATKPPFPQAPHAQNQPKQTDEETEAGGTVIHHSDLYVVS